MRTTNVKKLVLAALFLALALVIVWMVWLLWLDRYVVYTEDGAHFDFSLSNRSLSGQIAVPPEDDMTDAEAVRESLREAWFDTLSAIEAEFDVKAENIAVYIKNMTAEVKALKQEEDALRLRRKAFEKSVERLKGYLLGGMNAIGRGKIDMPRARLSIRQNAESLVVDDEQRFIGWAEENAL